MKNPTHVLFYTVLSILGAVFAILLFAGCGSGAEFTEQFPPYVGPVVGVKFTVPSPTPSPTTFVMPHHPGVEVACIFPSHPPKA